MSPRIQVVLVDDHPVVRLGFRRLIEECYGFEVSAECDDVGQTDDQLALHPEGLLVMDLRLSKGSSLGHISTWRVAYPNLRILVLSEDDREETVVKAIRSGADGYLLKSSEPEKLQQALRQIAAGGAYMDPDLLPHVFREVREGSRIDSLELTPREGEVLRMLMAGQNLKAVAEHLVVSMNTAKSHLHSLYRKFRVSDRTQLVLAALEAGF